MPCNEKRFEPLHDISDWNGKYESKILWNFSQLRRDTDIPGTVMPPNCQKDGPAHDIYIDCNPHVGKKSLRLGMVNIRKTSTRTQYERDQQHGKRDLYEGIIGAGPGAYDPEKVRQAHHMQSNFKQEKSPVPFANQIARVQYGSIYPK